MSERQGKVEEIRARLEDAAVQVVLGESGHGLSGDPQRQFEAQMRAVAALAAGAGLPRTASLAVQLLPPADATAVRDGLEELQRAFDEEAASHEAPAAPNALAQDPELVGDFVMESREHLAAIEAHALTLEHDATNAEAIHGAFRGFHTIKGLAGFLELHGIREAAHETETLLDLARNSKVAVTPAVIDSILASADYLARAIQSVAEGRPPCDPEPLLFERLRAAAKGEQPGPRPSVPAAAVAPPESAAPAAAQKFSIRVDTSKLDFLMDMVGEMVIAQALVRHDPAIEAANNPNLVRNLSQLARITNDVQRTAMALRMVPVGQLFQRTVRIVRDLARKSGKQVELSLSGEDTELDKTIAEQLADPLLHMVRNAVDHGIEDPAVRVAAGKPATATVRLAAYHKAGQIVVEVGDDGRGLDREKILSKARERGLVNGDALGDAEVYNLIMEPGFSTAEQVTDVSGRGVGMDVVRKHIQKLRGRIDIETKPGWGTTFFLRLPLTLAIIDGLVVGIGNTRFIVPIFSVREVFRPSPDSVSTVQGKGEMALVHERLLPMVRLYRRLGVSPLHEDPCEAVLIVCESEAGAFCVMVDELVGKQEIVIKGLGEMLKNIPGLAGGTILGDGKVGLILDMNSFFGAHAA